MREEGVIPLHVGVLRHRQQGNDGFGFVLSGSRDLTRRIGLCALVGGDGDLITPLTSGDGICVFC